MQYRIVSPVQTDFETQHQSGELVDFSPAEAEKLLKSGAIEAVHVPFTPGNLSLDARSEGSHGDIKNLVSQIKSAANELLWQVSEIDSQIGELTAQRAKLTDSPVSKQDYFDYLAANLKKKGEFFKNQIKQQIEKSERGYGNLEYIMRSHGVLAIDPLRGDFRGQVLITESAFCFYFRAMMVQRLADELDGLDWPKDAVPAKERAQLISALDTEIAGLKKKRDALTGQLSEAGISG